jgi:phosphate-selective porin OprO/OprP
VVAANNFDPFSREFGALLVGFRYAQLSIDDDAFTQGFSNPNSSAREARELALGVNWILNKSVLLAFNYEKSKYKGGAANGGDREDEDVALTRIQLAF